MAIEQYVQQVTELLTPYFDLLESTVNTILDQEVSKYPIFVLTKGEASIGVPIVERLNEDSAWSIHVSTLEEFAGKQIIRMDRVDDFREIYKDPTSFFCFFILELEGSQFVFVPKPGHSSNDQ